ncbi:MAG: SpoIIE family protein phosphatase [Roseimicrobium sp.]
MMGWIVAVVFLLVGTAVSLGLFLRLRRVTDTMRQFVDEDVHRADRRRRVFDVLHVLSDAILSGQSEATVHRLITEGAVKVVESEGAVLYLLDDKGRALVPRHCTVECPPLIALPERIVNQAQTNAGTLRSFLRLHSIAPGEGVLGSVFANKHEENIADLRHHPRFDGETNPFQQHVAALVAPLQHGGRTLGVLAAATVRPTPFGQHELEMFDSLAKQCGFALGNAKAHQEAAVKRTIEGELRTAREIQRILLPEQSPKIAGFEMAARNIPARMVSGDYFDFVPVGKTHEGVVIADVCGKGVPAALITAMCRSVLRSNARENQSPGAVLGAVNRNLFPDIREDMFITVTYAIVANDGSSVALARAGHTTPLIWRHATHTVEAIAAPGLAVGVDKGDVFERVTKDVNVPMETGDVLLLFTDGVNEAVDHKGLEFGEDRIRTVLGLAAPNGAQAVVDVLCDAVQKFVGSEPQADDITLVVIRKR